MEPFDQERLGRRVRAWFDDPERVRHYVEESGQGATAAEGELLSLLPRPPAAVLDIGCGAGRHAVPLAKQGFEVVGADTSLSLTTAAASFADAQDARVRLVCIDSGRLPFAPVAFDAVVAIKVYAFIPGREQRLAWLSELARLLRPGGALLLTSYVVPTEADALDAFARDEGHQRAAAAFSSLETFDTFIEGRGYVHWFTREGLLRELRQGPFVVQEIREDAAMRQVLLRMQRA